MNKKIRFCIHPPFEFYYALAYISFEKELLEQLREEKIKPEASYINITESIKSGLSRYLRQELEYFFDRDIIYPSMGFGEIILWGFIIDNPEIDSVSSLIRHIEGCSCEEFFSNLVYFTYYENKNKRISEAMSWDEIKKHTYKMMEVMKNTEFKNPNKKIKIIECLENPQETKERYCLLLRQFYEKAYKNYEKDILSAPIPYVEEYEKEYNKDSNEFFRDYFKKDINVFSDNVNIHISYISYCGSEYWATGKDREWVSLGFKTIEYQGEESKRERALSFLKKISDKKRIEVVELLSQKDWYVNEIAERLKISAATASYHLSALQDFGIVDFERVDHRFYYHLNKEKLKKLFKDVLEVMKIE